MQNHQYVEPDQVTKRLLITWNDVFPLWNKKRTKGFGVMIHSLSGGIVKQIIIMKKHEHILNDQILFSQGKKEIKDSKILFSWEYHIGTSHQEVVGKCWQCCIRSQALSQL